MNDQASIAAAVAAFQQGDLDRARSLAEDQLAKGRQLPLLQHLVGLIDCRLGRFDSGVERLRQAVEADPRNIAYRTILVRALIDAGRPHEAVRHATPPHGNSAAEIALWQARAEAAFYAGDRATETQSWRALSQARPQDVMVWTNLGRCLLAEFRLPEAEEAYRKAFALTPALPLRHEIGLLLERSNQLEELGRFLDQAIADGVSKEQLADLWALRALREGDIEEASRLAEAIDIRPDPFRLYALKAKIADRAGRPDEAFAAAAAMNCSVENSDVWRARGREYREELRTREQAMKAWLPNLPRLPKAASRSPAFLVGFPRSGTTLSEIFLRGHPDVRVLEEIPLLEAAAKWLGGIAKLNTATPEQLTTARDRYFAGLGEHIEAGFTGLVVDKQALNMLSLPLIVSLFPDARIIFAQRHPCDCVLSGFMQGFIPNNAMSSFLDLNDAADLYDAAMRVFTLANEQLKPPLHKLIYEELTGDPAKVLRPLTDFLGLEWRPELLDHRATAAARTVIKTPSYASVSEPLSKQPSGRWRRYRKQLEPVLPVLLPWAGRLGYVE